MSGNYEREWYRSVQLFSLKCLRGWMIITERMVRRVFYEPLETTAVWNCCKNFRQHCKIDERYEIKFLLLLGPNLFRFLHWKEAKRYQSSYTYAPLQLTPIYILYCFRVELYICKNALPYRANSNELSYGASSMTMTFLNEHTVISNI